MGAKTVAFVQKAFGYASSNPSFVPAFLDLDEFACDSAVLAGLTPIQQLLDGLALGSSSTMMLAGSDAYAAALVLYNNSKFLAKNKQPGAQSAYDDLSQRFPGNGGGWPLKLLKGQLQAGFDRTSPGSAPSRVGTGALRIQTETRSIKTEL